jgi:UPF0042 nucleotide-binding protein
LTICLQSFAYKRGIPADSHWVLDARGLPNPFYVAELKPKTGLQPEVQAYVLGDSEAEAFLTRLESALVGSLPSYQQEGRQRLMVSIGCTGGKHRSVTLVERLAERLKGLSYAVVIHHREAPYWGSVSSVS